jgi:DNA-binding response OmpR family regulator
LIIEDEPLIVLNLKMILEKRGFEVLGHAGNFKDAHELFCFNKPDIVLSDIKLEENESGIEIVKCLKKISDFQVIYITSYDDERMIDTALETNPLSYITKPFKESDLNVSLKLASINIKNKNINDEFKYHQETKALFYKNKQIILSKQESDLFHICYINKGAFIPIHRIEYHIWGAEYISDSTRRGLIHRLKKKLNDNIFEYSSGVGCKVDGIQ